MILSNYNRFRISYFKLNLITIFCLFTGFWACGDGENEENSLPTCTISNPLDGSQTSQGVTVTITVMSTDKDGTISVVDFYVDEAKIGSSNQVPYKYLWDTSETEPGSYIIKAIATDSDGGTSSDQIEFTII